MEQSSSARQGTGQNLWIPKVPHRVHNSPPLVLSQINPGYILLLFFFFFQSVQTSSEACPVGTVSAFIGGEVAGV